MKLTRFWKLLESRSRLVGVLADWQQRLGDTFAAIEPLLRPTDTQASYFPNPRAGRDPLKIVHHENGDIVAVPEDGERIRVDLTPADVLLYELNLTKLRVILAKAMGLATARTSIDAHARILLLGQWKPRPAASASVYLVRAVSPDMVDDTVRRILGDEREPMLLLTPTAGMLNDDVARWCRCHQSLVVPLDDVVAYTDSEFTATAAWSLYLDQFCAISKLVNTPAVNRKKAPHKRAARAAKIELLERELIQHIRDAGDSARQALACGREPSLLPRPSKAELARRAGLKDYHVTRCFKDSKKLQTLWKLSNSLDDVMKYGSPRRRRRS